MAYAASPVFAFEDAEYSVALGKTVKLKTIAQGIDGKLTYTWASSDESIATVSKGTVTGVSSGTFSITCTATDKEGNSYWHEKKDAAYATSSDHPYSFTSIILSQVQYAIRQAI